MSARCSSMLQSYPRLGAGDLRRGDVGHAAYTRSMTLAELIEAARGLPAAEKVQLADEVMGMVDEGDADQATIDAAWTAEIGSRVDDILTGKIQTVPFRDVAARIEAKLAAARH